LLEQGAAPQDKGLLPFTPHCWHWGLLPPPLPFWVAEDGAGVTYAKILSLLCHGGGRWRMLISVLVPRQQHAARPQPSSQLLPIALCSLAAAAALSELQAPTRSRPSLQPPCELA